MLKITRLKQNLLILVKKLCLRKLIESWLTIFNSVTDISYLKYFTKISRSVLSVLSSEGDHQLQVLCIRTLGNFLHRIWSCGHQMYPQQFFFWIFAEFLGVSHISTFVCNPRQLLYMSFPTWFNHGTSMVQSANTKFLLMKTHRVLNRLSKCANVRYRKNEVFL